ncbi:MAG: lipoyl protein ligase domain-containing protein [Gemmatimonadaceae bacterium]
MRWRLLHTPALPAVENMALDAALLDRAHHAEELVLRVYSWRAPTLSLGRNQRASGVYDPARAAGAGVEIVRRPTGGRAVLHHREATYSVTGPAPAGEPLRESYGRINRLLLDGLRRLGVRAELARSAGRAPLPTGAPCFETPTEGELVVGGRKLVGSAQYREQDAFLQHGSILIDDDQPLLAALATQPLPPAPPAATLRDALGRAPDPAEVAAALFAAVREGEDASASPLLLDAALATAARLAAARYASDQWTWRR